MASSTLPGDRRWASARKGMTVLGKVPKPINLPSQRLENHGLDPNVEIVPKGTLTWGNKSSSTTPNAWASSNLLSPKTDGGAGSPSHLSGRPSSGGSGTRPSTAGSDRSQDPSSGWGPGSRPSSASGMLSSSQAHIVASRPHSAETRPGSSQLSRFAEHQGEPQVAWGPSKTAERLSVSSSKIDAFTLDSGDFPTLGSEKDLAPNVQRGNSSHGRPTSSGADDKLKEKQEAHVNDEFMESNPDHVNVNILKPDKVLISGSDTQSSAKWQNEPPQIQSYTNMNMPPHQFDSWHHPPQPLDGSWQIGAPGGPYRPPGPPGSYTVEPFMYYPRHFPPTNDGVMRPGARHDGFNPVNGDQYRPQSPGNSFIIPTRPIISARPGTFRGPVAYEHYYPAQIAFMGASTRPGFCSQFQNQNGSKTNQGPQGRPYGHNISIDKEQMPSERANSSHQGQYKVLLKPHDGSDNVHSQEKRGILSFPLQFGKEYEAGSFKQEPEQPAARKNNDLSDSVKSMPDRQVISHHTCQESNDSHPAAEENLSKTSEGVLSRPEVSASTVGQQHNPVTRKNTMLIEKIEGLNNKVRNAENQNDMRLYGQEKSKQSKSKHDSYPKSSVIFSDVKASNASQTCKLSTDVAVEQCESQSSSETLGANLGYNEVDRSNFQRKNYAGGSRVNSYGKPMSDSRTQDDSTKDSSRKEHPVLQAGVINGNASGVGRSDFLISKDGVIKDFHSAKELEPEISRPNSIELENQRAKLREQAAQRAKQLQKEEEERTREQKAKAFAKLEELNRRSAVQSIKQTHGSALQPNKESEGAGIAAKIDNVVTDVSGGTLVGKPFASVRGSGSESKNLEVSASLSMTTTFPTSETFSEEPSNSSVSSLLTGHDTEDISRKTIAHSLEGSNSRNRQVANRRRQKFSQEKHSIEKSIAVDDLEGTKHVSTVSLEKDSDKLPPAKSSEIVTDPVEVFSHAANSEKSSRNEDPSLQHKRKNNRNPKNITKADEACVSSTRQPTLQSTVNVENYPDESSKAHSQESELVPTGSSAETNESQGSCDITAISPETVLSKASQELYGRANYQLKSQMTRKPRNQQVRITEKLHRSETIWAPVKVPNKSDQSEESSVSSIKEGNAHFVVKNDQDIHMTTRTKRAEIERYVPKPAAKELLQPDILQQSSSFNPSLPVDMPGKSNADSDNTAHGGSSSVKVESTVHNKMTEDNRFGRRVRTHASWRQRNPSDSTSTLPNSGADVVISDDAKSFNKISDQTLPAKLENSPEESMKCDDLVSSKSLLPMPTESPLLPELNKDKGTTNRLRRQHIKFQKPTGSNYVPSPVGDSNVPTTVKLDLTESDSQNAIRTESKNPSGEHTKTHWKPKSHPYSHGEQQGSYGSEGTRGTSNASNVGGADKEISSQVSDHVSGNVVSMLITDARGDSMQQRSGASKTFSNVGMPKNHPRKGNQDVLSNTELATSDMQHEHQASHAVRRHGLHVGHVSRGQEANYRNRDFGQDTVKQYGQGDKRKNYTHFEYQPVGGNVNKPGYLVESNPEGPNAMEGQNARGQKYKEKGHNQTRRNSQYFRRSGSAAAVHVGDSQHSGE